MGKLSNIESSDLRGGSKPAANIGLNEMAGEVLKQTVVLL